MSGSSPTRAVEAPSERPQRHARPLVTVRRLLAVPRFGLALVGGAAGIDRPIRWAHSTELPDPRPYLRGQELVLTVGAALRTEPACRAFVEAVAERDCGGIGLGVGNVHPAAPAALVEACDRLGLPLVEVPVEVPFLDLTEYLAELLAVHRSESARRSYRREADLVRTVADHGLDGLVSAVARELGCAVVALDGDRSIAAAAGDPAGIRRAALLAAAFGGGPPGARGHAAGEGWRLDVAPVTRRGARLGWLAALTAGDAVPAAAELLHHAAPLVALELAARSADRTARLSITGRLLTLVRDGRAASDSAGPAIDAVGLPREHLVAAAWWGSDAALVEGLLGSRMLLALDGDRLWTIGPDGEVPLRVAEEAGVACGIGSPVPLGLLRAGLAEADEAFRVAAARGRPATWRDLARVASLLEVQPPERLESFAAQLVAPLAAHDRSRSGDLVATLRAYIECDGSVDATARSLHVHANTLRHRLRRIVELTGRDPRGFEDRIAFRVGLFAHDRDGGAAREDPGSQETLMTGPDTSASSAGGIAAVRPGRAGDVRTHG